MKITIVQGSPRTGSNSSKVAVFLASELERKFGASITMVDVQKINAPNYGSNTNFDQEEEVARHFGDADGLLFVVPEYNGRVPGAFKNLTDYYRSEFKKKPMATCTVSAGPFGGLNALHDLRSWMLYVEGVVSPTKLLVSGAGKLFDQDNTPGDAHFNINYPVFLEDFIWLTKKLT